MRFKGLATVGLAAWATLGAPYIDEAEADEPVTVGILVGGIVFIGTVGILGLVAVHAIDNDATVSAEANTEEGTISIEVNSGGDDNDPEEMPAGTNTILFPQELGFIPSAAYQINEELVVDVLPGQKASWTSNSMQWAADVLTPGHLDNIVSHDVQRIGDARFVRTPGTPAGVAARVDLQVDIDGLAVSTSPIPKTHGFAGFAYRVTSPQLGVLFEAGGSVHQGQFPVFFGEIPTTAYQSQPGQFQLPAFHQSFQIDIAGDHPVVDVVWEFHTFGTGVKEEGSLDLAWKGGLLGEDLDFDFAGDPLEFAYHVVSLTGGPTPLALFDPADPRSLAVGPAASQLSGLVPLDANGQASRGIAVPNLPFLAGLPIFSQAITLPGQSTLVDNVSNPTVTVLGDQGTQHASLPGPPVDRSLHTATELPDGRVLLVGGIDASGAGVTNIAFYDPQTMSVVNSGANLGGGPRAGHEAILLAGGDVLVFGGTRPDGTPVLSSTIIATGPGGVLVPQPAAPLPSPRILGRSTLLADGRVLLTGGATQPIAGDDVASFASATFDALIYDPAVNQWTPAASLRMPLLGHGQSLLPDGTVLVTGGIVPDLVGGFMTTDQTWLYDPVADAWLPGVPMPEPRALHSQIETFDGGAFLAGGGDIAPMGGNAYDLVEAASTFVYSPTGDAAFSAGGALPSSLLGPTICWICHGPEEGYAVGWYCGLPCIGPIGDGPIILNPGETAGATASSTDMVKYESGFAEGSIIGTSLFPREGGTLTLLAGEDRLLMTGGEIGPAPAELFVTGSGSQL